MVKIKRYQAYTRNGIEWSDWFVWNGKDKEKWQVKNKQKNEYKEVTEDEWKQIQEEQDKRLFLKYGEPKKKEKDGKKC